MVYFSLNVLMMLFYLNRKKSRYPDNVNDVSAFQQLRHNTNVFKLMICAALFYRFKYRISP